MKDEKKILTTNATAPCGWTATMAVRSGMSPTVTASGNSSRNLPNRP